MTPYEKTVPRFGSDVELGLLQRALDAFCRGQGTDTHIALIRQLGGPFINELIIRRGMDSAIGQQLESSTTTVVNRRTQPLLLDSERTLDDPVEGAA